MNISGYTFVRNAEKLAYPLKESILSILELVDEFVIVYVEGEDSTLKVIESIKSDKIKLVKGVWEPDKYSKNSLYSYLSDQAKNECKGDWLFYLQVDEVVHEQDLVAIKRACNQYLNNEKVEGLLFNYSHFWGDYKHCFTHHGWYPKEIRIIKNLPQIHSWRDGQSFRYYNGPFTPSTEAYFAKEGTRKLSVATIDARIYHYGWVRPPWKMSTKESLMSKTWDDKREAIKVVEYDYGLMNNVPEFKGTHPKVMSNRIGLLNWQESLNFSDKWEKNRALQKHEKLKYKIRSWIELNLLGGREIGGFKNYKIVAKFE